MEIQEGIFMRTDTIRTHHSRKYNLRPHFLKMNRRRRKRDEDFRKLLEGYTDESTELNEYPLHLPRHALDLDQGTEDVT
jgi:hypothetical protein